MNWDLVELGMVFKNRRLELRKKQSDLADDFISSSTISVIERGGSVSRKMLEHYCKKLGWNYEDIPKYLNEFRESQKDQTQDLLFQLEMIENDIDCVNPSFGLERLRDIPISNHDPLQAYVEYLRGKASFRKGSYDKAAAYLKEAIRLCNKYKEFEERNIKSISYYILGQIAYLKSDFLEALSYVEEGLRYFHENDHRPYLKYCLLISKVIYLEKLGKYVEGITILKEEMWPNLHEIDTDIRLHMYEMHATLLNHDNMPEKAIQYAKKGIEIARRVEDYDRCFELWTTLGISYKRLGDLEKAKQCFETVLRFEEKIQRINLVAHNYRELGILYLLEGNEVLAEKTLRKAEKLSYKSKDPMRQCEALIALGKMFERQNRQEEAIQYLEKARKIAEANFLLRHECDAVVVLIELYKEKNSIKHLECSARLHQIVVQLIPGGDEFMAANTLLRRAAGDPPNV